MSFTLEDYQQSSALDLSQAIRQGRVSQDQVLDYAYQVIEDTASDLNNIVTLFDKDEVVAYAHALEDKGQDFFGVPLLVKGLGDEVKGGDASLGVPFLKDQRFEADNDYVLALKDMGFVIIGQSAYPQFGWINATVSDWLGDTANPWNLDHNPGGSSGGAAAAVASGQVPLATSSDAGGSTRIPASWSGLIGLHPSRGLLEASLEVDRNQTSHFALVKSMADLQAYYKNLYRARQEPKPSHLSKETRFAYTLATPAGTPLSDEAKRAVLDTVAVLEDQGYQVSEVADYPIDGKAMMMAYYVIAADNARHLEGMAQDVMGRSLKEDDVEILTWALFQTAQLITEDDLVEAWQTAKDMEETVATFFQDYDVLITPTTAYPAPERGYRYLEDKYKEQMSDMSSLSKEERVELIYQQWLPAWVKTPYTQMGNLTGTPSLSLPLHVTNDGLPLGVLFNAPWGSDQTLIAIGKLFEEEGYLHLLK